MRNPTGDRAQHSAAYHRAATPSRNVTPRRTPRLTGPTSAVTFGVRTPQGDIMERTTRLTEAEIVKLENADKLLSKAELLNRVRSALSNAELPDHW